MKHFVWEQTVLMIWVMQYYNDKLILEMKYKNLNHMIHFQEQYEFQYNSLFAKKYETTITNIFPFTYLNIPLNLLHIPNAE